MAADDWVFDFVLTDAERDLAERKLKGALRFLPPESALTGLLRRFEEQVAAGTARIRLPVGRLDVVQKVHFSQLLAGLSTSTGVVTCTTCSGAGTLPLPRALVNLQSLFDYSYSLSQLSPDERQPYLELAEDPAERERVKAARRAELERQRDAQRRRDAASAGVAPGTPREDYMPARSR